MKQTTLAGLLAAVVLLAGIVIVQASRPAEAGGVARGGDPCPADIDNSGNVDVVDFLQLLSSWGPCPSPQVVAVSADNLEWVVRIWSDNTLEVTRAPYLAMGCWLCEESQPPPGQWMIVEAPPQPAGATPVDINVDTHWPAIFVTYADGSTFWSDYWSIAFEPGCTSDNPDQTEHCELDWSSGDWQMIGMEGS